MCRCQLFTWPPGAIISCSRAFGQGRTAEVSRAAPVKLTGASCSHSDELLLQLVSTYNSKHTTWLTRRLQIRACMVTNPLDDISDRAFCTLEPPHLQRSGETNTSTNHSGRCVSLTSSLAVHYGRCSFTDKIARRDAGRANDHLQ